jgi:uncharacterized protein YndB with AHSA1/START domain
MPAGTIEFTVPRPIEEVFAWVGNLQTAPQWVPDLISMRKVTEGPVGVGTRYVETVQMGSKQEEAQLRVTHYDPPRLFAHEGEGGPSRFTGRFVLTPTRDGTTVIHDYTVKMTGCFILLTPFVNRWVRKNTQNGIDNLRKLLTESGR